MHSFDTTVQFLFLSCPLFSTRSFSPYCDHQLVLGDCNRVFRLLRASGTDDKLLQIQMFAFARIAGISYSWKCRKERRRERKRERLHQAMQCQHCTDFLYPRAWLRSNSHVQSWGPSSTDPAISLILILIKLRSTLLTTWHEIFVSESCTLACQNLNRCRVFIFIQIFLGKFGKSMEFRWGHGKPEYSM